MSLDRGWASRARALGPDAPAGRGERWTARREGRAIAGIGELARVPAWAGWDALQRRRLALVTALLHHRPQLDRELRSEVLGPLAAMTGEGLFDALCNVPAEGQGNEDDLPPPSQLGRIGEGLVERAWPQQAGTADAYAASLAGNAAALVLEHEEQ